MIPKTLEKPKNQKNPNMWHQNYKKTLEKQKKNKKSKSFAKICFRL
jgi:hypothetical protein